MTGFGHVGGFEVNDALGHGCEVETHLLDGFLVSTRHPDQLGSLCNRWTAKDRALKVDVLLRMGGDLFGKLGGQRGINGRRLYKDDSMIDLAS